SQACSSTTQVVAPRSGAGSSDIGRPPFTAVISWVVQEPEVERREDQDDADVRRQPLPGVLPEEQEVHGHHDGDHREPVQQPDRPSSHRSFLLPVSGCDKAACQAPRPTIGASWSDHEPCTSGWYSSYTGHPCSSG